MTKITMKTAIVNFKTTPKIKTGAQEYAQERGISLSALLNQFMADVGQIKRSQAQLKKDASALAKIDTNAEEPSEWLKQQLKESEEDRKAGRVYSFKSIDDSMPWLKSLRHDS